MNIFKKLSTASASTALVVLGTIGTTTSAHATELITHPATFALDAVSLDVETVQASTPNSTPELMGILGVGITLGFGILSRKIFQDESMDNNLLFPYHCKIMCLKKLNR